jgi:hypothetical protein
VQAAIPAHGVVALRLVDDDGTYLEVEADHIIAATGYQVSVARLSILEPQLRSELVLEAQSPVLSSAFESSVPELYFIGVASANSFGPVMRFALGAKYAADRLGAHLGGIYSRTLVKSPPVTAVS